MGQRPSIRLMAATNSGSRSIAAAASASGHHLPVLEPAVLLLRQIPTSRDRSTGAASFDTPQIIPTPSMKWGTLDVGPGRNAVHGGRRRSTSPGSSCFRNRSNAPDPSSQIPAFECRRRSRSTLGGVTVLRVSRPIPAGLLGHVWIATDHSPGPSSTGQYLRARVGQSAPEPGSAGCHVHPKLVTAGTTWTTRRFASTTTPWSAHVQPVVRNHGGLSQRPDRCDLERHAQRSHARRFRLQVYYSVLDRCR